jgi:hypothetical protein
MSKRPHKYRAVPTVIDGIRFASKKEAARYGQLKMLEKAGEIHGLELQPEYVLDVLGIKSAKIGKYRADFSYCECRRGEKCLFSRVVVEDVKGFKTPLYRWKKRHVEAQYGIEIREV